MGTYVFDQAWQNERARLGALESLFDGSSRRLLTELGVAPGAHCLEVGCGAGGIALWLADRVGPTGRVVATDLDTRFVEGHGRPHLDVRTHDVVTDPLDDAAFDVVHARAVLCHLPDRQQVLKRLVSALRPGGRLLVEDIDFGGATARVLGRYASVPPPVQGAVERVYAGVGALFAASGADPCYGSRLAPALVDAGLADVGAEVHAPVVSGGSEQWTRGSVEQLADRLVSQGLAGASDVEAFLALSSEPGTYYLPPLLVSAWGTRP